MEDKAYVIVYGADPTDRLAAYAFASRAEAVRACGSDQPFDYPGVPPGSHAGGHCQVVQTAVDVTWHNGTLLAIFNGLTESGVKRFASHEAGVKRLLSVLPEVATVCEPKPPTQEQVMAKTKTEAAPAAAKKGGRAPIASNHPTKANWKKAKVREEGGDSMRIAVMRNMIDTPRTPAEISKLTKGVVPTDRVVPHIAATFRDLKIGYKVDAEGRYVLDMPPGTATIADLIEPSKKAAEPKPAKAPKADKKAAATPEPEPEPEMEQPAAEPEAALVENPA
jgi:hypothetical protein